MRGSEFDLNMDVPLRGHDRGVRCASGFPRCTADRFPAPGLPGASGPPVIWTMESPVPGGVRPPSPYRVLLLGATVLSLLAATQHFAVMQFGDVDPSWKTVGHALSREMPWWYLWVAAAPFVIRTERAVSLRRGRLLAAIPF